MVTDRNAGAGGDDAGETEGGGGVDAEGFVYDVMKTASVFQYQSIK